MATNADKLFTAIHRCSKHHVGSGYHVRVFGVTHRLNTSTQMAKLLSAHVGARLRYRISSFADGSHAKMVAVIS
ncbi:MAG: hypothetical protein GY906_24255 [bacterium]|nr:hypothetical protein [bacterium]